jgi:hypothetical protein
MSGNYYREETDPKLIAKAKLRPPYLRIPKEGTKNINIDPFDCPLVGETITGGACLDIQGVRENPKWPFTAYYLFDIDRANELCEDCPYLKKILSGERNKD